MSSERTAVSSAASTKSNSTTRAPTINQDTDLEKALCHHASSSGGSGQSTTVNSSQGSPTQNEKLGWGDSLPPPSPSLSNAAKLPDAVISCPTKEKNEDSVFTPAPKPTGPPPKKTRKQQWIVFCLWFNVYRKMFCIVFGGNMIALILCRLGKFKYAEDHLGAMALANLFWAVLMRNEFSFRIFYTICIYGLRGWAPLPIKYAVTSMLQHHGGVHSGCAISGTVWLINNVSRCIVDISKQHKAVIAVGVINFFCLLGSIASGSPWVRNKWHNSFEQNHRFFGWVGVIVTWTFTVLTKSFDTKRQEWDVNAKDILTQQGLWYALGITVIIAIPWCTLRRVPVEVEIPSPKVAVLKFDRGMQQGLLGRLSRSPLMEYHAFGIISEGRKSSSHYMVCGVQGDFTNRLVTDPPRCIWTRELKFAGIGHASAMFKRGIRICTGTGIGAALSTCIQSPNWFLIWIGSDQEKTFGPTITALIHDNIEPERRILWDSKVRGGRPKTMELFKEVYHSFNAEVIMITSNMKGNDEMMQGCKEAGLHAFGTLWDF